MRFPLTVCAVVLAILAGCSSTPLPAPATDAAAQAQAKTSASAAATAGATSVATPSAPAPAMAALPAHRDPASPLSREHSVFFDYDDDTIQPQWLKVIERHGRYLADHPALGVLVQGNTDERGGREYNLALGQRRAEAVRRVLLIQGAKPAQVEAVSLGEERPVAEGHDESAWQQNRRADMAYPAGK